MNCIDAMVMFVLGMSTGILLCVLDLHLRSDKEER